MNWGIMLNNYSLPLFFCHSVEKKKLFIAFFLKYKDMGLCDMHFISN